MHPFIFWVVTQPPSFCKSSWHLMHFCGSYQGGTAPMSWQNLATMCTMTVKCDKKKMYGYWHTSEVPAALNRTTCSIIALCLASSPSFSCLYRRRCFRQLTSIDNCIFSFPQVEVDHLDDKRRSPHSHIGRFRDNRDNYHNRPWERGC